MSSGGFKSASVSAANFSIGYIINIAAGLVQPKSAAQRGILETFATDPFNRLLIVL